MHSRIVIVVALLVALGSSSFAVLSLPASAAGELTRADVDEALQRRREASSALEQLTGEFERAMADEEILRERIGELATSVSRLEQEIGTRTEQVKDLVRQRYMAGGSLGTERLFTARTFTDIPVQLEYSDLMHARDIALLRGLEAAEALHVDQQALLDRSLTDQQALVGELTQLAVELGDALSAADAEYNAVATAFEVQEEERRRKEEEERLRREEEQRRAAEAAAAAATAAAATAAAATTTTTSGGGGSAPATTTTTAAPETTTTTAAPETTTTTTAPSAPAPVVTDGKACPVNAAVSFSDTWGQPRSGGRLHKGVDMVAARNAPLVAIESGVVTRTSNSSLGGLSVYLTGASGARYYYAHLENFADGIGAGASVGAGTLLGGNGSSGNAPDWLPHLHFQYAPPGSDWVNPYPLVKALCG